MGPFSGDFQRGGDSERNIPYFSALYRVYQNEVNSLKNHSKLQSMKYLVNILFELDKLVSCRPLVAKSLEYDR